MGESTRSFPFCSKNAIMHKTIYREFFLDDVEVEFVEIPRGMVFSLIEKLYLAINFC